MIEPLSRRKTLILTVAVEGGLICIAIVLGAVLGIPLVSMCEPDSGMVLHGVVSAVPVMIVMLLLFHIPVEPVRRIEEIIRYFMRTVMGRLSVWDLGLVSILAGVGEELMFRGVIQHAAADYLGTFTGIFIAGILFGMVHLITPFYAVIASLLGVYLGWLFVDTGSLIVPIVCHAVYDFSAFLYFRFTRRESQSWGRPA